MLAAAAMIGTRQYLQFCSVLGPCLDPKRKCKFFVNRLHGVLDIVEKINRITQMDCKSRDESNEPN